MSNIGTVLGWKFNHQSGMATTDGVITSFPGTMPTDAELATYTAEYEVYKAAQDEIDRLEAQVTNRRLRESIADPTWINAQEALIAIERSKL